MFFVFSWLMTVTPALVMAQTCNPYAPPARPDSRYINNLDGSVHDKYTGLMWMACSEGMSTSVTPCDTGLPGAYTWQQALQRAAAVNAGSAPNYGYTDWRVPNIKELQSLIDIACYSPAINSSLFPGTLDQHYWSSTAYTTEPNKAWVVNFVHGELLRASKLNGYPLRLVRGGY
jgi:hypothetical protein